MSKVSPKEELTRKSASRITFQAAHLEVTFDSTNLPPTPSASFVALRREAKSIWHQFEEAIHNLVALDDKIHEEVLTYISKNRHATHEQLWQERCRLTLEYQQVATTRTEHCCSELAVAIDALCVAAGEEPQTLEARATLEIDTSIMKNSLEIALEIVEGAKVELNRAEMGVKTI